MKHLALSAAIVTASLSLGSSATQAEVTQCTEITAVPTSINLPGVYCLKKNFGTSITTGAAITINANNVTLEMNGYRLGGATAGLGTQADGIFSNDRTNIIIRNGAIRGFFNSIVLDGSATTSSGHIVEDMRIDGNRRYGIHVSGSNTTIENNTVTNTGPSDMSTSAIGIYAENGKGTVVKGNTVSGLDETFRTFGIVVQSFSDARVIDNAVFDLKNSTEKYGIAASNSERVAIKSNTVSTGNGGLFGIGDFFADSTNIACIDNEVSGFTNNTDGCDTVSGNVAY